MGIFGTIKRVFKETTATYKTTFLFGGIVCNVVQSYFSKFTGGSITFSGQSETIFSAQEADGGSVSQSLTDSENKTLIADGVTGISLSSSISVVNGKVVLQPQINDAYYIPFVFTILSGVFFSLGAWGYKYEKEIEEERRNT